MVKGLYTAYTGMINEQHRMDVLTNNLANANTNGYKKEGATSQSFSDQLALKIKDYTDAPFTARGLGIINPGVKIGEGYVDWSEGPMKETNNTFDMAIGGYGFFGIEYTNKAVNIERDVANQTNIMYTRDGNFTLNADGVLVTQDGDYVLSQDGGHIEIDPDLPVEINTLGEVIQDGEVVATVGRFDFEKTTYPDGRITYNNLEHYGENMYIPIDGTNAVESTSALYAGFLEQSNVSVVDEMVNMIAVQRNYDTNQRMITTVDSSLDIAVNQLGRLS
ncbi:flagellar basal-body rod protein FlgG [Butyrivibrio hungatei DSM 14810]|uniref:Flagellar basal-body rod protein FlgG n=1 Tax=Butyrivibrio hungatei DSM 14810 TaxID=1121132 RepID=A0A1M7SW66_9FIRM|nr:flagellar hook-basal body protein [Butyrivibrio hungatei]SHN62755.1 flagellar basal-body rod protein FlgG [Butyrivibrio hungatei DSM 14810]